MITIGVRDILRFQAIDKLDLLGINRFYEEFDGIWSHMFIRNTNNIFNLLLLISFSQLSDYFGIYIVDIQKLVRNDV